MQDGNCPTNVVIVGDTNPSSLRASGHSPKVIPLRESKSMCGRHISSLLDSGQYNVIVHGLRMAIDSPANDLL